MKNLRKNNVNIVSSQEELFGSEMSTFSRNLLDADLSSIDLEREVLNFEHEQ